ncbi:uncharacterized protein LOC142038300 isoform X1 [Buteo buteo]|uniref:uncharacterized protein LOC142038300 isoform X1 n=1 Tax=Buteo buteo TaxID=30397 RepID=UPI003EBE35EF
MRRPLPEHSAHAPLPNPRTPRMRHPPAATHWSPRYTYGCPLGSRRRRPAFASLRMRRRHGDTRMSGAPPPPRWRSGEGAAPLALRLTVRVPLGLVPRGPCHPRLCPGVPPPERSASAVAPGRAESPGGAEPTPHTPPAVWQHHHQPPSFLPSFLPAAAPGLGRGRGVPWRPKASPSATLPPCRPKSSSIGFGTSTRSHFTCAMTSWWPGTCKGPTLPSKDADIRELPRAGVASAAFTFFRSYKDGLWRFESAANPGWFLCTSARGHQPLGLSRHPDDTHLLDFYFQLC